MPDFMRSGFVIPDDLVNQRVSGNVPAPYADWSIDSVTKPVMTFGGKSVSDLLMVSPQYGVLGYAVHTLDKDHLIAALVFALDKLQEMQQAELERAEDPDRSQYRPRSRQP